MIDTLYHYKDLNEVSSSIRSPKKAESLVPQEAIFYDIRDAYV